MPCYVRCNEFAWQPWVLKAGQGDGWILSDQFEEGWASSLGLSTRRQPDRSLRKFWNDGQNCQLFRLIWNLCSEFMLQAIKHGMAHGIGNSLSVQEGARQFPLYWGTKIEEMRMIANESKRSLWRSRKRKSHSFWKSWDAKFYTTATCNRSWNVFHYRLPTSNSRRIPCPKKLMPMEVCWVIWGSAIAERCNQDCDLELNTSVSHVFFSCWGVVPQSKPPSKTDGIIFSG